MLYRRWWEQRAIRPALRDWIGYTVQFGPAFAFRNSALPPDRDRRQGPGALAISGENLLFHTERGETEIIQLSDICWIAAGNMWRWRRQWIMGKGAYGPHLIIEYKNVYGHQTLAFYTPDNHKFCRYLRQYHHIHHCKIPRGFRIWNDKLILPK
jgi:hypothetical protein